MSVIHSFFIITLCPSKLGNGSQPFLDCHLDIFFHPGFLGVIPFFTAWLFWYSYHFLLYLYIPKLVCSKNLYNYKVTCLLLNSLPSNELDFFYETRSRNYDTGWLLCHISMVFIQCIDSSQTTKRHSCDGYFIYIAIFNLYFEGFTLWAWRNLFYMNNWS